MAGIIQAQTIASLLKQVLDPGDNHSIHWDAPIATYVTGGAGSLAAFANVLNTSPQFKGYGLFLTPANMQSVSIVQDMLTVLITWFQKHGWTVII